MANIVKFLITTVALGFGIFIFINQDISLIYKYGRALIVLGAIGIIFVSAGTLFSSRYEIEEIHNKYLNIAYFFFIIMCGVGVLFKGEYLVLELSKILS